MLDDGSVLVSGTHPDTDTYTVQAESELKQITAMRLEALPDKSLPRGGTGRADDGGFVVSKVQVFQEPIRPAENVKYVRIELPRHDWLTMAEVQVFRGDENVARAGTATSIEHGLRRFREAGDRWQHRSPFFQRPIDFATAFNDNPWWEVDLGAPTRVDRIVIWNEKGHPLRLVGARVSLLEPDRKPAWQADTVVFARPHCHAHD